MITRRKIVIALGAGALAPLASLAQQPKTLPKIGVLRQPPPTDHQYQAFLQGLRELGYVEGKHMLIDYRHGDATQLVEMAQDMVRSNVNVIFAPNPQGVQAARKATTTIPIVVAVIGDPIASGLAASLAHPGGNVTGLTALGSNLSGKRLELLKELVPRLTRVAVIWNPTIPDKVIEWKEMVAPARALKIELLSVEVHAATDFEQAIESVRRLRAEAIIGLPDPLVFANKGRIIEFATRARLPSIFAWSEAVEGGALIAYGPNIVDLYRRSATYIVKILKGAKPGDLPIEEPSRFDFAVNMKTAKALGVAVPNSILVRAEKIIE